MMNFDQAPFLVIWEVTQACDLACAHCRASDAPARDPRELTTDEGYRLLETIRTFGDPLMVFTGGDPLKRPDLFSLVEKSTSLGLRTTVTPSATPLLTSEAIGRFQQLGVARMAVSLDGPNPDSHDGFRRVRGSFDRTLFALEEAKRIGLDTQVNTTVTRQGGTGLPARTGTGGTPVPTRLDEIASIVERVGAKLWSVFFLVTTGRALVSDDLTAEDYEQVFAYLYELSKRSSFDIKTTEAQHYRRYVAQRRKAEGGAAGWVQASRPVPRQAGRLSLLARQAGINDGKGFVFISHRGEIYPSGFLPIPAGNVRRDSLVDIYRHSPLFLELRDSGKLRGKCGLCEYRNLCGGSRSRAFALTGDYMGEELRCVYQPPGANLAAVG